MILKVWLAMVEYNSKVFSREPTQFPGFYTLEKLTLNGTDISDLWVQFDIVESISFPVLTGSIQIVDHRNIINDLKMSGDDSLFIKVNDQTHEKIEAEFKIFKISNRTTVNYGVLSYTLHFVSKELFKDHYTKISKAFSQAFYEDVTQKILKENLESSKPILFEKTVSKQSFVIPNWSPIHAINWMAGRAKSENSEYDGGNFLFFETIKGFNFISLDNLYDENQNKTYGTVSFRPMRSSEDFKLTYDKRIPKDTLVFEEYNISKSYDTLENMKNGMYANKNIFVDVASGKIDTETFNYVEDFNLGKHLGSGQKHQEAYPLVEKTFKPIENPEQSVRVIPSHQGLFTKDQDGGSLQKEWLPAKISQKQQLENFKIQGILPGHIGLVAGMQVKFSYPNIKNVSTKSEFEEDIYYSGQYLITDVRRIFQKDKFYLSIQMIKESLSFPLEGLDI